MRKFMLLLSLVALVAPIAAFADAAPTAAQTANQICSQEKTTTLGPTAFTQTYGTNASKSNAFGKCVSKNAKAAQQAVTNANASCKAQQADPNFAAAAGHDNKTFDQFYGKNGKGNAFGKCVSQAVQSTVAATAKASAAALKSCKALRKSNLALFTQQNGTGKDALGKCVSKASTSK
jgi:hypothetical protein